MKSIAAVHQAIQVAKAEIITAIQASDALAATRHEEVTRRLALLEEQQKAQIAGFLELSSILQVVLQTEDNSKLKEQAQNLIGQLTEITGLAKEWLTDERFKKKFLS